MTSSHRDRLTTITKFLRDHEDLWCERPFAGRPRWVEERRDLARFLGSLAPEEVGRLQRAPEEIGSAGPTALIELAARARALTATPPLPAFALPQGDHRIFFRVPARKRQQIRSLTATARALLDGAEPAPCEIVDWCGGKGHLGRLLSTTLQPGATVTCIERQRPLCEVGERLARRLGLPCRFIAADVLTPAARDAVPEGAALVGLHACGELGCELLRTAAAHQASAVLLATCCYHRVGDDASASGSYRPLSRAAAGDDRRLALDQHALRLVSAEQAVAPPRVLRQRQRERTWRLGLDLLRREADGVDAYRPLSTVPTGWLRGDFDAFCRRVAEREGFDLPPTWDDARVEAEASARLAEADALGLVRGPFRRVIELWLVLDRAQYLVEQGFARVAVGTFCDATVTPRNLAIAALGQPNGHRT